MHLIYDHGTRSAAKVFPVFSKSDDNMEIFDLAALKIKCLIKRKIMRNFGVFLIFDGLAAESTAPGDFSRDFEVAGYPTVCGLYMIMGPVRPQKYFPFFEKVMLTWKIDVLILNLQLNDHF